MHRRRTPYFLLPCLLALGGCTAPQDAPPPPGRDAGVVAGQALYRERIAPPPGARLRVQLIDATRADAPEAVLLEHEQDAGDGPPFAFSLPYAAEQARERLALHAELHDGEGNLWFVTPSRVPYAPAEGRPVELVMAFAGGEPTAGGPDGAPLAGPWEDARARGVVVRALGQEPGWVADVGEGGAPRLALQLDYGTRQLDVPAAEVARDGAVTTYRGTAGDTSVVLRIVEAACEDVMSGEPFPARAELEVEGRQLAGCARRLAP
ncbi:YbaY family lipoprotein [Coralloluteibacterium thermophilus]|uniref:YbaY family lipoprotein n=1 Tax=Coralloluteibacterium thermophilum TaxID=2707049 RepID=A0ABV9NIW7_9GAMM